MLRTCRTVAATPVVAIALALVTIVATAQDFPTKSLRLVVATPAGGAADVNARVLGNRLGGVLGQSIVIENRTGGAGNVAASTIAGARNDGYSLMFAAHPVFAVNPVLYDKLPFNPEKDFEPLVLVSRMPHVLLVSATLPVATLRDLVAAAKARPGEYKYGSGGPGTSIHLAGELLGAAAAIDLTQIQYRGGAPSIAALIGGEIQMLFDSSMTAIGHVRGGRLRGLAIASPSRVPALAEVPTFDESGLNGFEAGIAHGVVAPAGVPQAVTALLTRSINTVLAEGEYRKQMTERGVELVGGGAPEFRAYLDAERRKWGDLIRKRGIKAG
jgi:tripartite-type tricarboxylate transporter receptor subunit TctC